MGFYTEQDDSAAFGSAAPTVAEYYTSRAQETRASNIRAVAMSPLAIPLGAVDTIGQSIGLLDEASVENSLKAISTYAGETYAANKTGYRMLGDIGATFVGAGVAAKLLRSGSILNRGLNASGKTGQFISKVIASDTDGVAASLAAYERRAVAFGEIGISDISSISTAVQAKRAVRVKQGINDIREGIAAEAFVLGFQNESELYFPEGQSTTDAALMSVAGLGLGVSIGQLILNPAIKRAAAKGGEKAGEQIDDYGMLPGANLVVARRNKAFVNRGDVIGLRAEAPDVAQQTNSMRAEAVAREKEAFQELATTNPIEGFSADNSVNRATREMLGENSDSHPRLWLNVVSIEDNTNFQKWFEPGYRKSKLEAFDKERKAIEAELAEASPTSDKFTLQNKLEKIKQSIRMFEEDLYPVSVDRLGLMSAEPNSVTVFDEAAPMTSSFAVSKGTDVGKIVFNVGGGNKSPFGIDITGQLWKGNTKLKTGYGFSTYDHSKFYAAMPKALNKLVEGIEKLETGDIKSGIGSQIARIVSKTKIGKAADHMQLDYIEQAVTMLSKDGQNGWERIGRLVDLSEFKDLDELRGFNLNAKYKRAIQLMKTSEVNPNTLSKHLMLKLNNDHSQNSYALEWFADMYAEGKRELTGSYKEMLESFAQHFSVGASEGTIAKVYDNPAQFAEKMLKVNWFSKLARDADAKMILVRKEGINGSDLVDLTTIRDVNREYENIRVNRLFSESKTSDTPVLNAIVQVLEENTELANSVEANALKVAQASADTPVIEQLGQLGIFTKDFGMRHVPGAKDASLLHDITSRRWKSAIKEEITNNAKSLAKITQRGNEDSALRALHYVSSMQRGWEIEDLTLHSGQIKLAKDSKINQAVARQAGLEDVPEYLPEPVTNTRPLVMDELSYAAIAEANRFSNMLIRGDNTIMKSVGKEGLKYRVGHIPIPSRFGQEMAFVVDERGKVIDFTLGGTRAQARAAAEKRVATFKSSERLGVVTKDSIEQWKLANDQAWNRADLDVSDAYATSTSGGRGPEGRRQGLITDVNYFNDMVEEIYDRLDDQGSRFMAARFSGTLENLRSMSRIANANNIGLRSAVTGAKAQAWEDATSSFGSLLTGRTVRNDGSLYGAMGSYVEQFFDATLAKAYELVNFSGLKGFKSKEMINASKKLAEEYGFDPLKYAVEVAERSQGTVLPANFSNIMRGLAGFTQTMSLKLFEVGHAVLTTSSIMTTTPHAAAYFRRRAGETAEAYQTRVGHVAQYLTEDKLDAIPHGGKLTMLTMAKWFKGEYTDVLKEATERGYLEAHISEFMRELQHPSKTPLGQLANTLLDKAGLPSTWSEKFSRQQSFLVGYEMFKTGGVKHELALAMANDLANKAIADYRPQQRAELFKGATGIPLAIFQTFSINYFQRLLSAVEDKHTRALLTQLGTQQFVFGAESLPGWDLVNEQVLGTWNHKARPEDNLREMEAKGLSDILLYGTIGNLPKLLGLDAVAIHTRGEAQLPRTLTPLNIGETPIVNLIGRSTKAIYEGAKTAASQGAGGYDRFREAAIYAIPNRPLRGLAESIQGYSTNRGGDVIEDNLGLLSDPAHVAVKLTGLGPLRDAERAQVLWRDRQREFAQRAKVATLRAALVAEWRNGNLSNERLLDAAIQYQAYGGSPRGFRSFMKNVALKASESKFDRKLLELVKSDQELGYWAGLAE